MSEADDFVETIKASVEYGISNKAAIISYGILYIILYIIALALPIFGFIVAVISNSLGAWAFLGLAIVLFLVLILALYLITMGYWIQCFRAMQGGSDKMPGLFDDVSGLVVEGIKGFIVPIVPVALIIIINLIAFGLIIAGFVYQYHIVFLIIGLLFIAFGMVLCLPLAFLSLVQLVVYAGTGSLLKGINPLESVRLIRLNPRGAAITAVQVLIIYVLYYAITYLLSILCVTYVLMPFLMIPAIGAVAYVMARFYRQTSEQGIGKDPAV